LADLRRSAASARQAVCFYISGHGFGHASRQIEIINALGATRPDLTIVVRTSAARWLFERTARVPMALLPGECDTGVVQVDSLRLDERETMTRAAAFYDTFEARVEAETDLLRAHDVRFVVADAPALGASAGAAIGVPAIIVSNFTWDWIYESYEPSFARRAQDGSPSTLDTMRAAYRRAQAAWRLPMHGGFATFDTIVDVPFVARHARHDRAHVRRTLGLPADRPLVLSSFGGYGVQGLELARLDCLATCGVVLTPRDDDAALTGVPAGIHQVTEARLYGSGLRYEDLVGACDVVATKPGYGIIAECVANRTAILYTSRGNFREYEVLVREMPRVLRCEYLDHDDLFAGRWQQALDRLLSSPAPAGSPRTDGADVIAAMIAAILPFGSG
jgi:hypothetical protein